MDTRSSRRFCRRLNPHHFHLRLSYSEGLLLSSNFKRFSTARDVVFSSHFHLPVDPVPGSYCAAPGSDRSLCHCSPPPVSAYRIGSVFTPPRRCEQTPALVRH